VSAGLLTESVQEINPPLPPVPKMAKERQIVLLPSELLLWEFILECAQSFPDLEIWITGGWVRDRLLHIPSSDLEFALNNVTGREFGKSIENFSH
jgi:tRNA nucleotidyltransferase (CCA-adding enzyme)